MPDKVYLRQMQALPLIAKVHMSQARIREWYEHFNGNVFISFSGGKDSTVLTHVVHEYYPDVPLVFVNTGLEYPEIQAFAKKMGAEFLRPKMRFDEVISTYGYPIISKEVSESIHYARKIRIGGGTTILHHRKELLGKRADIMAEQDGGERHCKESLSQKSKGGVEHTSDDSHEASIEQPVWRDIRKRGNETLRRRADITQMREDFDGRTIGVAKSLFNKEKWLPLCTNTLFKISHQCCHVMKKSPLGIYQRKNKAVPFIGTLAEESRLREQAWVRHGCNAFDAHKQTSQPLSFWTEQDILKYLYVEGWDIASVYGDIVGVDDDGMEYQPLPGVDCKLKCTGCQRTGCVFCGFGTHLEKGETRFQKLAKTHPKQYEYCMSGGQWVDNPDYDPTAPKMDGDWENWNPKQIWVPSKKGLGMKKVFDDCNQIYGKGFIKYE